MRDVLTMNSGKQDNYTYDNYVESEDCAEISSTSGAEY